MGVRRGFPWRTLAACSVLAAPMLWSVAAGAHPEPADELHVAVHAPGGKGCISGEKLKVAVQKKIGTGKVRKTVDVRIQTNDPEPGWTAEVAVAGKAGLRSVKTQSSCSELDDGLVLVVSMLVDPEEEAPPPPPKGKADSTEPEEEGDDSWGTNKPTQEEGDEEGESTPAKKGAPNDKPKGSEKDPEPVQNKPGQNKPGANNGSGEDDKNLEGDEEEGGKKNENKGKDKKPKQKVQAGIGASLVTAVGIVPAALTGVRGSVEWLAPTPVTIEAGLTVYLPYSESMGGQEWVYRQMQASAIDLTGCPVNVSNPLFRMSACAGVAATWIQHSGQSEWYDPAIPEYAQPQYYSSDSIVISPTAEMRLDLFVASWLRLRAGAGLMVPVNPVSWGYTGGDFPIDMMSDVIFQGQVGIQVVLPP